jgi:hypothetical protein
MRTAAALRGSLRDALNDFPGRSLAYFSFEGHRDELPLMLSEISAKSTRSKGLLRGCDRGLRRCVLAIDLWERACSRLGESRSFAGMNKSAPRGVYREQARSHRGFDKTKFLDLAMHLIAQFLLDKQFICHLLIN